jgi:hypothetical protein
LDKSCAAFIRSTNPISIGTGCVRHRGMMVGTGFRAHELLTRQRLSNRACHVERSETSLAISALMEDGSFDRAEK